MKRYIIQSIFFILGFLTLASCQDDEMEHNGNVVEGVPVSVVMDISSFNFDKVVTKADRGTVAENEVKNLHIFIFRSDYTLEDQADFSDPTQEEGSGNRGSVEWPRTITSGQKYIVAIANTGSTDFQTMDFTSVTKFSDLNDLVVNLEGQLIDRFSANGFVMSGYWGSTASEANKNQGSCVIPQPNTEGGKVALTGGKIWLRHLDSKIKFDVRLSESKGVTREFIPLDWEIVNVPNKSNVFVQTSDAAQNGINDFFNTKSKFEVLNIEAQKYLGGSFTFYMLENRKDALSSITEYNQREYKSETGGGPDDPFVNADPRSTYVVLKGTYYEYQPGGEIKLSADVRYTIHLGYAKTDNDARSKASDFDSERNKSYTYNVTIEDVNNIKLEVTSSEDGQKFEERQPGAEGDIIISDQNLLLDSHYEVKTVTFSKNKLSDLSVMVRTPYEKATYVNGIPKEGIYKIDKENGAVTDKLSDFEWVLFAKNDNGVNAYQSYAAALNGEKLQNVKSVLQDLYNNQSSNDNTFWDKDEKVTYTVFINEFYYDEKPGTTVEADWRDFVNCDNRQMHILCDTKYSLDEQSSLTTSNIMINQRSIKTIYNKNLTQSELPTAWGIETKSEDGLMKAKHGDSYSRKYEDGFLYYSYNWYYKTETKTNGRYNTFQWLFNSGNSTPASRNWDYYVDFKTNKNKAEVFAQYACFHRNRDLNGNGVIDDNEVRWYLPATNQYIGLWIGQDALPNEARLLQQTVSNITESNRYDNHLLSSNGVRFWVEEGVSTGSEVEAKRSLADVKVTFNVRCARNLGFHHPEGEFAPTRPEEGEPTDYVKAVLSNSVVTSIDLSRVDPSALRKDASPSIGFNPEHSGGSMNYPYRRFEVSNQQTATLSYNKSKGTGRMPTCTGGTGYRIPNQRELALIAGYSNTNLGNIGSCTYSDLTYKTDLYTMQWNGSGQFNYLTLSGNSVSIIRCVKDY